MNWVRTEMERPGQREQFRDALLRGDRPAVEEMSRQESADYPYWRDELLGELTEQYLEGAVPFSQLTVLAEAAAALAEHLPPVAVCGSLAGNPGDTGRNFIQMLLRAWGVPTLDLGADVPAERFLDAVSGRGIRFVIAAAFSADDAGEAVLLHQKAVEQGIRDRFDLLICGAKLTEETGKKLQLACTDHRAAAVARWVVQTWKNR